MKGGFMKASHYKKAIEEESPRPKETVPVSRSKPGGHDEADVEIATFEDVYADGHVVAVRGVRSGGHEEKSPSGSSKSKNRRGGEAPHPKSKDRKGKGKAKAVRVDDDRMDTSLNDDLFVNIIPPRPPLGRPGWGRNPKEDPFHIVPNSHGGPHKKRAVFRFWPRDPNGEALVPNEKYMGRLSPDGYPWGATLYDFFHVHRIPSITGIVSVVTGSAMCAQMKAIGEVDVAAPEIEWAESEGDPRIEGVADTEELIRCMDTRVRLGGSSFKFTFQNPGGSQTEQDKQDKNKARKGDTMPTYIPPPPEIPITSPFHHSHYPVPWPCTPFGNSFSVLLQERIPLYLLPQTLYVHDPFCLLTVRKQEFRDTSWASRPDIIRTYNLRLSDAVRLQIEEERRKVEEVEEFKARTLIILRYQRTKEQIKKHEPVIEVPLPPYLRRPSKTEDAHLYISPIAKIGEGHHSVLYKGEWELPRDIFTKQRVCQFCFEESKDKEIQKLKDTGRWGKMMKAASWGPDGFTGREPKKEKLDAICDPPKLEGNGGIIEREVTCVVPAHVGLSQVADIINESDVWYMLMTQRNCNTALLRFTARSEEDESGSEGGSDLIMRVNPTYKSPESCTHKAHFEQGRVPRTAKFTVVAKLSLENDSHLAREASNYQKFPERFFHHYNGYTIVSQLHTLVPVNAVVPQFYGYYTPNRKKVKHPKEPSYLSPILLLEDCGIPIDPDKLSGEDQEECASLLLRFQRAGWIHESVAPRNFLVQYGKPTEFPLTRSVKPEPSFRLIDFGRSRKCTEVAEKRAEEIEALRLLSKLFGKMAYTLH